MTKVNKKLLLLPALFLLAGCNGGMKEMYSPGVCDYAFDIMDDTNSYHEIVENDYIKASINNKSSFSLSSSTSAYTNIRNCIENGYMPNKDAVMIDQMLNYFDYDYTLEDGQNIGIFNEVSACPWNDEHVLASIAIKAKDVVETERKTMNVVFLIDISGSMSGHMELIKAGFSTMVNQLSPNDRISIVTYASGVKTRLDGATLKEKSKILKTINNLMAGGSTNGSGGIQQAYEVAKKNYIEGANNLVILATDGDFNVGISDDNGLKKFISEKRDTGIYLSILGFGMRNYHSNFAETLARNGNGNMFYVDSEKEAQKIFGSNLASTFEVYAKDVKTQIIFDKEQVDSYRLIDYEHALLTEEEYEDESTDAGEILAGDVTVAMYEIILNNDANIANDLFNVELKYKDPVSNENKVISKGESMYKFTQSNNFIFQTLVVEYGLVIRDSKYKSSANYDSIIATYDQYKDIFNADKEKEEFRALVIMTEIVGSRYINQEQ